MNRTIGWRLLLTFAVVAVSMFFALPLDKKINLGLDLQGGMHLVFEVDADKAVASSLDGEADGLRKFLESKGVVLTSVARENETVTISLANAAQSVEVEKAVSDTYGNFEIIGRSADKSRLTVAYTATWRKSVFNNAIEQALETLRNRVDQFGVAEPTIQREGDNRILIQLPGVQDRERAINLIGKTARLEFRMVNEQFSPIEAEQKGVPSDSDLLYERKVDPITKKPTDKIPFLIYKKVEMTGALLSNAQVRVSDLSMPYVSIDFNREGARVFGDLTTASVGKRMAIVLDGNVYSAPVIREAITGGTAMIEGSFSYEEAKDLAIVLRAGALPAPLIKLEERSVGPSLGADSIRQGVLSALVGGALVVVFMLVYYRIGGLIADVALVFNIIILMGAMAYFGSTLTLPGIAGIILTIGIAVDANVLVFERIREELNMGKTVRAAVEIGFSRAFLTILDTHVTTIVGAIVLFQFGTGPIKGFAITLSIGLIASMFTAVFVSRTLFMIYLGSRRLANLNI
ncbi:MAG: protein translocase subunit SecD [Nitrospinae bacterium]|nr:protein translocase subunit SecD [Nitrospinota bacterium]